MQPDTTVFALLSGGFGFLVILLLAFWDDIRSLMHKAIDMIQSVEAFIAAANSRLFAMENAEQAVLTLLSSQQAQLVALRAELANAGVTPEQLSSLDAFLTTLDGDTAKLTAAAVVAGTPAEGAPIPEPEPAPEPEAEVDPEAAPVAEEDTTTGKKK